MVMNWLGTLPDGWKEKQIRHIFRIHNGATPKSSEGEYWDGHINWITPEDLGNINGKLIDESRRKISAEGYKSCGVSLAKSGSIALSTRAPIGHVAKTSSPACVNQGCRLLEPLEGISDFWYYACLSSNPILKSRGQGTTFMELPRQSLAAIKLPVPPESEQEIIASFLDYKTAQIDALIAKKQALLAKLAEKRTALISQAVTKGLDPSVPMKDSGVKWLGEIPEHWAVKKFKYLGETRYGLGEPPDKLDGGIPFIRATDIYRGQIDGSKVQTVDPGRVPWSRNPELKAKDILVVRSGAYTGDSAIVPPEWAGAIAGYDMVFTAKYALPEYISFNLLSKHVLNGQIYLAKNRAAQPHLNAEELGEVIIALPRIDEQRIIVSFLMRELSRIEDQIGKITAAIEKLQEYRSALITHAVTGKIDVRDFVVPEPAESNPATLGKPRRSGMDCRNPEAMDGESHSHPCDRDTGTNLPGADWHLPEGRQAGEPDVTPCRYDGLT